MNVSGRKVLLVSVTAVAAALVLFASVILDDGGKSKSKRHVVHIQKMVFTPAKLEIAAGDTVEWINDDVFLHAMKSSNLDAPWQSKDLPPHASWAKQFAASPKSNPYLCPYHPTMLGEVTVVR